MASDASSSFGAEFSGSPDEEAEIERALQKEIRKDAPMTATGCLWRGLVATAALMILMCGGGYFGVQSWLAQFAAKRDALIKDLRAKGEPLSPEDLMIYTTLPEGTIDLTARYQDILKNYDGSTPLSQREELLPIIGTKGSANFPGPDEPWLDEGIAQNYLAKRPWLKEAEDLAEVEGEASFYRDYRGGYTTILNEIQYIRALARDLHLQFETRMRSGDRAGAMRSLRAMFKVSSLFKYDAYIPSNMVRIATHQRGVQSAARLLDDGKATPEEVAMIRGMLNNDFHAAMVRALKAERANCLITMEATDFETMRLIAGWKPDAFSNLPSKAKIVDVRPGDTAKVLEMIAEAIEVVEENDFPEILKQHNSQMSQLKKMANDEREEFPWNRHILPGNVMPTVLGIGPIFAKAEAMELALKATLDVEEKMLALPPHERTKEAETAAIEAALPIDPFTGDPMKYVVDDQGYKIYSVGRNGVDDNGVADGPSDDTGVSIERKLSKPAE